MTGNHHMQRSRLPALALAAAAILAAAVPAAQSPGRARAPAGDRVRGKQVFDAWCAACHARGPGHPGTQSLAVKYHANAPAALEDRKDLSPEIVAYFVRNGVSLMPFFRKTEVSDRDLRDLSAYLAKTK